MDPPRRRLVTPRHSFTPRQSLTEVIPECQECESPLVPENLTSTDDCPSPVACLLSWDSFKSAVQGSVESLASAMSETLGIGAIKTNLIGALWGLEDRFLQETRTLEELNQDEGVEALIAEVDSLPDHVRQRLTEALLPDKARIALLVANGNRVGIEETQDGTHLVATATHTQEAEMFDVMLCGAGKVCLRSVAAPGTWLTAQPVCDLLPSAFHRASPRSREPEWKMFSVYPLGGNRIALRGHHGQYVTAEGGGGGDVYCDGKAIGEHEVLQIELIASDSARALSRSLSLPSTPKSSEQLWWCDRVRIGAHVHDLQC